MQNTPAGLYCPLGDFFIDPMRKVHRAVVTHAHADHARAGHDTVFATPETLAIMEARLGRKFAANPMPRGYGETLQLDDTAVSLHSAGHVLGSAQVLIEHDGFRVVASGDYKRSDDPTCVPFEVVPCDAFVTEATFALPAFSFPPALEEMDKLLTSLRLFPDYTHIIGAYSFGKTQRMMGLLRQKGWHETIYVHPTLMPICKLYECFGVDLGPLEILSDKALPNHVPLAFCPPSALTSGFADQFAKHRIVAASGWLHGGPQARGSNAQVKMAISDHAGWPELCETIEHTGAREVLVTHGDETALSLWGRKNGVNAYALSSL
nr:ligase-associated DNA damage response exonuclease [Pseudovibrio flavus]